MLLKGEGIVIKSIKYGESSFISALYTKEFGLISVIHNRANNKKRKEPNYFQALSYVEFICYPSKNETLHRVKEVQFKKSFNTFEESVVKNALKFFIAEVLDKIIKEKEQNIPLYNFIAERICFLNLQASNLKNFHTAFLIELLNYLGISPQIKEKDAFFDLIEGTSTNYLVQNHKSISGNELNAFKKAIDSKHPLTKMEQKAVLEILLEYVDIQLNTKLYALKSKSILEEVFE